MWGACLVAMAVSVRRPAARIPSGPPQRDRISSTAGCAILGPRTRSRAEDAGEQAADAVAGAGRLTGQIVIEPGQNAELGQGVITDIDPAQRVRHGAGGISDDVGIAGVGLVLARV